MTKIIPSTAIDFIGDIHGHAVELTQLLSKLGYKKVTGYFSHPNRKAFFVGDFVDRGPQIKDVLEIVKPMIENHAAFAVIGNHEFNAICYWTKGINGEYLREHNLIHTAQHQKTMDSLMVSGSLESYVNWFKTLPIYAETKYFRIIHAQWNQGYISQLRARGINDFSNTEFLIKSATKGTEENNIIECLLKGEEREVPGVPFKDKDGNERSSYRLKWWLRGGNLSCEDSLFEFIPNPNVNASPITSSGYSEDQVPVFFGHYWLKNSKPFLQGTNVCCLDFSVAKGGELVAYRWDGEQKLSQDNFVWIKAIGSAQEPAK